MQSEIMFIFYLSLKQSLVSKTHILRDKLSCTVVAGNILVIYLIPAFTLFRQFSTISPDAGFWFGETWLNSECRLPLAQQNVARVVQMTLASYGAAHKQEHCDHAL